MKDELISIIIPTYNRANTLVKAVKSVLDQSYDNIELIIVDDCSTDDSEELMREIRDNRLKYIKLKENQGPSIARNIGIQHASGKYIAFQDSDDIWIKDKIKMQIELLQKDNEIGMVYSGYNSIFENNHIQYVPQKTMDRNLKEGYIYKSILSVNKIGTPTMLIRKEVLDTCGGFDTNLKAYEDWELSIRIAKDYKIGFIDEPLVISFSNREGVNSNTKNTIEALCYILTKHIDDLNKYSLVSALISRILESCINNDNKLINQVQNILVPNIIKNQYDFELMISQAKRTCKFKNYYEVLIKLLEIQNMEGYFGKIFKNNKWESTAIYGMGKIGILLTQLLHNEGIDIKYGIDSSVSDKEGKYKIIKPSEITNDIDVIIISISFDYENIVQTLKKYTNCNIINIQQLIY